MRALTILTLAASAAAVTTSENPWYSAASVSTPSDYPTASTHTDTASPSVNTESPPPLPAYGAFSEASTASSITANPSLTELSGTRLPSSTHTAHSSGISSSRVSAGTGAVGGATNSSGSSATTGGAAGGSSASPSSSAVSQESTGAAALATAVPALVGLAGVLLAL